jgi:hypothetical protein
VNPTGSGTSVLGAAIDAAVGLGDYPDVPAATAGMTRTGASFDPNPEAEKIYRGLYERVYRKTYDRLLPLNRHTPATRGHGQSRVGSSDPDSSSTAFHRRRRSAAVSLVDGMRSKGRGRRSR